MLLSLWSPKGGSGTSVVAAACAIVLAGDRRCAAGRPRRRPGRGARAGTGWARWVAARSTTRSPRLARRGAGSAGRRVGSSRGRCRARSRARAAGYGRPHGDRGGRRGARCRVARRRRRRRRRLRAGRRRGIARAGRGVRPLGRRDPTLLPRAAAGRDRRAGADGVGGRGGRGAGPARSGRARSPTCSACRCSRRCRCVPRSRASSTRASSSPGFPTPWPDRFGPCSNGSGSRCRAGTRHDRRTA